MSTGGLAQPEWSPCRILLVLDYRERYRIYIGHHCLSVTDSNLSHILCRSGGRDGRALQPTAMAQHPSKKPAYTCLFQATQVISAAAVSWLVSYLGFLKLRGEAYSGRPLRRSRYSPCLLDSKQDLEINMGLVSIYVLGTLS